MSVPATVEIIKEGFMEEMGTSSIQIRTYHRPSPLVRAIQVEEGRLQSIHTGGSSFSFYFRDKANET
jgi:hypothetical protein